MKLVLTEIKFAATSKFLPSLMVYVVFTISKFADNIKAGLFDIKLHFLINQSRLLTIEERR
jgi:hypothetical protein